MAEYQRTKANVDLAKLQAELVAAGLPVTSIGGGAIGSSDFTVVTSRDLTPAEITTMDSVIAAHDGRPRQKRPLLAILTDIQALAGAQQLAVWNDVLSGTPPKWQTMSSDQAVWSKGSQSSTTTIEKQVAVAFFVRENVGYLVNPSFDPTINIPGDEPIA